MERGGWQFVENELRVPVPTSALPPDFLASGYGDPERALIEHETPTQSRDPETVKLRRMSYAVEISRAVDHLLTLDRVLLALAMRDVSQEKMARATGLRQPSVSYRLSRIRSWLALVVPVRIAHRDTETPIPFRADPDHVQIWNQIVWHHRSQSDTARIIGRTQGMVRHTFQWRVSQIGDPKARELGELVLRNVTQWKRPHINGHVLTPRLPEEYKA